jgi:hypothetical protein
VADKGKHIGRVRALTTLSPVRPERERKLWLRLRLVRWIPNAGRPLQELAFIHYGRWTVLDAVPAADGSGAPHRLNNKQLLFESNYDGGVSDYLDAFADVVPHRLARLWGTCFKFESDVMHGPGAENRAVAPAAFRKYVHDNELDVLHFYAAYPEETVISVRQAIGYEALLKRRSAGDPELEAAALGPVPDHAGAGARALRIVRDWWGATWKRYGVRPLTVITPIEPANVDRLVTSLRRRSSEDSPFKALPATHYARFVLMPPGLINLGQPDPEQLDTHYLLFTSNHDGSTASYIEAIRTEMPKAADEIWGCCARYPGREPAAGFAKWFADHNFTTDYFVEGYAAHAPKTILQLTKTRRDAARAT